MLNALIEVIVLLKHQGESLVEVIQKLHGLLNTADVSHFAFMPALLPEAERCDSLEFEEFKFGALDLKDLKHRCTKAGSDFFDLHGKTLNGRPAISSPIYKRVIFDMVSILKASPGYKWESPIYQAILRYFEALAAEHFEMMWSDYGEKKLLIDAFGCGIVDEEILRRLSDLSKITIYLNFGSPNHGAGYVVPVITEKKLGMPHISEIQSAIDSLESAYQFSKLQGSSLYTLLRSVCRSTVSSKRFRSEQRLDEAYLHQVIALEQVFSEKEKTTQAVGGRTAALTHTQLGLSYKEAKDFIIKLYAARSRFVHDGEKVPSELLERIEPVVLAVMKSLIHLCHFPESKADGFPEEWLKRLDYIIAGFDAGIHPTAEMAIANGLIAPDALSLP